jgi:hypothetical protein
MDNPALLLMTILVYALFLTGCVRESGISPAHPATTSMQPEHEVSAATPAAITTPREVVTVIHRISPVKDIKDSELLFALQVPEEWNVTTRRLRNPENTEGLVYQTDLVSDRFSVITYTISRSWDQNYRDRFRQWSPAPAETTLVVNGITFDRFESAAGNLTNVSYVARKTSANERGYASVLIFTAGSGNRFEKEDYEKIVSSFRYFSGDSAADQPGEEIKRIVIPGEESGGMQSAVGSGSPGLSGGSSPEGCSRCRG